MIKLLHIDCRLIHGQVAVFWVSHAKADTVVVATDRYANDQLMKMTMTFAKPKNTDLVILNTADAISYLNDIGNAQKNILIVTGTTAEALRLAEASDVKDVNVGTITSAAGAKKIGMQVFLNKEEINDLTQIHDLGKNVSVQARPTDKKMSFDDIMAAWRK